MTKGKIVFTCELLFLVFSSLFLFSCKKKTSTTKSTEKTDESGHSHVFSDWQQVVKPTCSEEGLKKRTCSCGEVEYEEIPKSNHTYVNDKCTVCGHETLTSGFTVQYISTSEEYFIVDYKGTDTTVRIPYLYDDGVNGEHNIYIGSHTDEHGDTICNLSDTIIKKIVIGSNTSIIGKEMFARMKNLEEVDIESKVLKIDDKAFYGCEKLSSVLFNEELEYIGYESFHGCDLKEIRMPANLKKIEVCAFENNYNLEKIYLNNTLESIDINAFNNTAIKNLRINYALRNFGYQENLKYLNSIIVDSRNTKYYDSDDVLIDSETNSIIKASIGTTIPTETSLDIDDYAFSNLDYSGKGTFVIPSNVGYIGFNAFSNTKFDSIELLGGTTLGSNSFSNIILNHKDTTSISFSSNLETIYKNAFQYFECYEIIIPSSVTYLDEEVFKDCRVSKITIYQSTLDSEDCNDNWNYGIDTDYTTITIIDE